MYTFKIICLTAIAYLIGNISPATMVGRMYGVDIKKVGSGNAGTTNVLRNLGLKAALFTLVIDVAKGFIAVKICSHHLGFLGAELAMVAVVIGHDYPILYKFKGGKGVATSFGAAWAVDWPSAFAALVIAAIAAGSSRKVSVGSIFAAVSYPILVFFYYPQFLPVSLVISALIIIRHRTNIKRLMNGEEGDISFEPVKDKVLDIKEGIGSETGSEDAAGAGQTAGAGAFPGQTSAAGAASGSVIAGPATISGVTAEPVDYYKDEKKPKIKTADKKKIAVIGNGSFGTAMANLAAHNGHYVMLWGRDKDALDRMKETNINEKHLPGYILSDKIKYTNYIKTAASGRDIVIFAVPAQQFRSVAKKASKYLDKNTIVVNLAKGIEIGTHKLMHEIAAEELPKNRYVALSGPSHAEEIAKNDPATVVVASEDENAAKEIQDVLMNGKFRVYTGRDLKGVELGGALKNVIAIGTGISDGMDFGDNAKAALVTRGLHEISALGVKLGAKRETFAGLSGIGDLMVTCDSDLSRNRRFGKLVGGGMDPKEALEKAGGIVEGYYTVKATKELAEKNDVEMPINSAIYGIVEEGLTVDEIVPMLMERDKKEEK